MSRRRVARGGTAAAVGARPAFGAAGWADVAAGAVRAAFLLGALWLAAATGDPTRGVAWRLLSALAAAGSLAGAAVPPPYPRFRRPTR